jgi:hypothetical protein
MIALVFASFLLSGIAKASDLPGRHVQIAVADNTDTTRRIIESLQKRFPTAQVFMEPYKSASKKSAIHIAIGPSAFRSLLAQNVGGVIVSTYISSQAYHTILESMPEPRFAPITAVYADPAPANQFQLISMLYKKPVNVAAILSDKTFAYCEPSLQRAAAQTGNVLRVENLSSQNTLNRVLNRLADVPVILATPDNAVYNADNIRNILITAYRRNQSVIGHSVALVNAGALATVYSNIDDINAQIDELIGEFEASGKLPEPRFPKYFSVAVNEDVARSLNIVVDDLAKKFSRKPPVKQP